MPYSKQSTTSALFCVQVQNLEYCAEPVTEPRDATIWQGDYHFAAPEVLGQGLYLKVSCRVELKDGSFRGLQAMCALSKPAIGLLQ